MGGAVVAAHLPLLAVPHGVRAVAEFFKTSQEIAAGNVVNDPFYDYSLRRVIALCADVSPTFLSLISVVVVCGYVAVTVLQKSRYRVSGDGLSLLCCVQVLCAIPVMMIVSPLIWFHHVVWLFPVLVALWSFGGSCYTRFCARASYLCIAPLLYLHVYTRNFTDMSVWYIKAIPLLVIGSCGVTLTLVIFRRWQDSELA
jgi:hypothetical protein